MAKGYTEVPGADAKADFNQMLLEGLSGHGYFPEIRVDVEGGRTHHSVDHEKDLMSRSEEKQSFIDSSATYANGKPT